MHPKKRAPSAPPKQQPLGAVVWGFIVLVLLYTWAAGGSAFRLLEGTVFHPAGTEIPVSLPLHTLLQFCALASHIFFLAGAAIFLAVRNRYALIFTKFALSCSAATPFAVAVLLESIFFPDIHIYAFLFCYVSLLFIFCFIFAGQKKKACIVMALAIMCSLSFFSAQEVAYAFRLSSADLSSVFLLWLWYFTKSHRMNSCFPATSKGFFCSNP